MAQRIVAALIEDRVAAHRNQNAAPKRGAKNNSNKDDPIVSTGSSAGGTNCNGDGYFVPRHGLIRALGLDSGPKSPASLEIQLRECLKEQSILPDDPNEPVIHDMDDEVLGEIKRTQHALRKLHQFNSAQLSELYEQSMVRRFLKITLHFVSGC